MIGAIAEYPVEIEAGGKGLASSFFGGWIIERGNFLCAGYASTRGYASNLRLRVPVFVVFCHGGCIIERGNFLCAGYASKLRLRVPVFVLFCGVGWIMERGNFLCAGYASTRGYASKLKLRVPVFVVFCVEAGSLNEAIFYVLATRLRVATRQT